MALLLLLAVPAILVWELRGARRRSTVRLSSLDSIRAAPVTWRVRLRWVPTALRLTVLVLLVTALARPQRGQADALLPEEGIDIALVLDASSSMQSPSSGGESRLAVAQRVLGEFAEGRERDRLGLVTFRSRSFVVSPLTLDYSSFQELLEQTDEVDIPDGTAIGVALADALNLLRDSTARSRIVILLTDGENNRLEVRPLAAARIAEALGVRVYTIGITSRAADPEAPAAVTNVNETALRNMAELTDGQFFLATDAETLGQIYESIDMLERSRLGEERFAAFDELAPYLLAGALALLAAEVVLTTAVLRRTP